MFSVVDDFNSSIDIDVDSEKIEHTIFGDSEESKETLSEKVFQKSKRQKFGTAKNAVN